MVRINLLPAGMLSERKRQKRQVRFLALSGIVILLFVGAFGFLFTQTLAVQGRLVVLKQEQAAVNAEIEKYSPYTRLQQDVVSRSNILRKAMGKPVPWVEVLEDIAGAIPSNVWLTDMAMTQGEDGKPGMMVVRGVTYDHPSTARWVEAMRGLPDLAGVRVLFSAEENVQEKELVRFEIRANLLTDDEYEPLAGRGE